MFVYSVRLEWNGDSTEAAKEVYVVASDMEDALRLAQDAQGSSRFRWKPVTTHKLMKIEAIEGMNSQPG